LFGPFILKKHRAVFRFAGYFAPKSKLALFVRNQTMNLMRIPRIADLVVGSAMADKITIPKY
jgi:hypothetical protein